MENNEILFSIITVVYNDEKNIEKTIQSIVNQTYANFEYIVIDGKSTDNTHHTINKYKNKITQIVSESDTGIYNAMNKGINLANGRYTLFMNSGDTFASQNTLELTSKIIRDNECDVLYGNVIKEKKQMLVEIEAEEPQNKHRMYFCHQSAFVKTSLLKIFQFDEKLKMSADFKLFKTLYKNNYTFAKVNIPIAIFDTKGVSNFNRSAGLKENIHIINECDKGLEWIRLMMRIYPTYLLSKLKSK
ncbi:glycosyltransferase family 2 protein [Alkaliflexus imshenetskii]|uniref:glycosyltransferase family 2 protein n=1 Tax=Alkaliflexus imshenetskii TaxID=286730 RepID=UPI00047BD746|nr:glycosyltransferase family 2 protein [Alkaliflexus imshenetskii]